MKKGCVGEVGSDQESGDRRSKERGKVRKRRCGGGETISRKWREAWQFGNCAHLDSINNRGGIVH